MVLNDIVMGNPAEWHDPDFLPSVHYSLPQADADVFENSTLDPSYIIHLIRQLLSDSSTGPSGSEASGREGLATGPQVKGQELPSAGEEGTSRNNICHPSRLQDPTSASIECPSPRDQSTDTNGASTSVREAKKDENPQSELPGRRAGLVAKDGPVYEECAVEVNSEEQACGLEQREDPREEAGCVLWDLAASKCHAEFLVENRLLEVLLTILRIPQTDRLREICLGILGNLACHSGPEKAMVASPELLETVIQQLYVEDSPSLTEACRLLSAGLHSEVAGTWVDVLKSEDIVERIMWIAGNTMNSNLLEKSTELLLAMVDSQTDAATVLLPVLWKSGLPDLLIDLLSCELKALSDGTCSRGDAVLDIVLQVAEALSISDDHATQLAANPKFLSLACQVIRLSSRDEIGPAAITAMVLVANLLSEDAGLITEVSCDAVLTERLFALLPTAGDDPGARNALWSILNRICKCLRSTDVERLLTAQGLVRVLAEGSGSLVEDLDTHREEDLREEEQRALAGYDAAAITSRGVQAKMSTASTMIAIMEQWAIEDDCNPNQDPVAHQFVKSACSRLKLNVDRVKQRCGLGAEMAKAEQNGRAMSGV